MSTGAPDPSVVRPLDEKKEIIRRIEEIASSRGFLYTVAILLRLHLFFDVEQAADIDWRKRLSFQELTLLLGLMVKHPIELAFPTEEQCENDIEQVKILFSQLHSAHQEPFRRKTERLLHPNGGPTEERDTSYSGEMMVEPIFYGGSGAYDFQYTELASKKYALDSEWIIRNKGFDLDQVVGIPGILKHHSEQIHRNLKRPQSFKQSCDDSLAVFTFARGDLAVIERKALENFLSCFSLIPGTVNQNLTAVGQYNALVSNPIITLSDDLFLLPIQFLLAQALYESPLYWMLKDKTYESTASKNRGRVTEDIAYTMLSPIFGEGLFRDVTVRKSKGEDVTDIDILGVVGNKAVVFQAKSKRLTELARLGDTAKLKEDFALAVQDAYNQGLLCREAILTRQNKLFDRNGAQIRLDESIDDVYLVCLTSDE